MNATAMPSNRHPVDQLAQVRATIKVLQEREADLKEEITGLMGAATSVGGSEFIAKLKPNVRKGALDEKKLAAKLGDLTKYRKPETHFSVLTLEARVLEEYV